ncbi:unnamed protein product [Caenorhabditis auriculariae]|uniref:Uncharacterized protein n=1 Tax=Caenorhabditis auriculariae TaxID=2777116 RepID=A0A8S1GRD1_9PELO|nr:unnamed protein product [Caenorhabditis auriculariae]
MDFAHFLRLCGATIGMACLAIEMGVSVFYHSNLLQMTIATSIINVITAFEKILLPKRPAVGMLIRVASLVAVNAMLFINLTHCFEDLSDFVINRTSLSHHHDDEHGSIDLTLLATAVLDIIGKGVVLMSLVSPNPFFNAWKRIFVLFSAASCMIAIFSLYHFKLANHHSWVWSHCESLTTVVLTAAQYLIILTSLWRYKPYLLADAPPKEQCDFKEFVETVKSQNPSVDKISHIHAHRVWPDKSFHVTMRLHFKVDKSDVKWVTTSAECYANTKKAVQAYLSNAGATKMTLEPVFEDIDENLKDDSFCIEKRCHSKDVGCCTLIE